MFKTFCHFNRHKQVPSHKDFIERLVIILLTNRKSGAPEPTHSSCSSGSARGMTMVMMRTVMVECEQICPSHSLWMLGIVLQANLQREAIPKSLQRYTGQHMGLLCIARSAPNQLQMQISAVFNFQMKWMAIYMAQWVQIRWNMQPG